MSTWYEGGGGGGCSCLKLRLSYKSSVSKLSCSGTPSLRAPPAQFAPPPAVRAAGGAVAGRQRGAQGRPADGVAEGLDVLALRERHRALAKGVSVQ